MPFNPLTNKIVAGKCEYCGIPAIECEHYKDGQSKPLDEKERLVDPRYVPVYKGVMIEPLKESEKASSMAEAEAKMKSYAQETTITQLPEAEESLVEEV